MRRQSLLLNDILFSSLPRQANNLGFAHHPTEAFGTVKADNSIHLAKGLPIKESFGGSKLGQSKGCRCRRVEKRSPASHIIVEP